MLAQPTAFNHLTAPWVLPSWLVRITIEPAPATSRWYGEPIVGGNCCIWNGWTNGKGHGRVKIHGENWYVHRWAFMCHHDIDAPPGNPIDHLCRIRACFNPYHLESVSPLENYIRGDGPLHRFKAKQRAQMMLDLPF